MCTEQRWIKRVGGVVSLEGGEATEVRPGVWGCGAWRTPFVFAFHSENRNISDHWPNMPSILVIVFILQLAIHLVNTVGAQTINDLVITHLSSTALSNLLYPGLLTVTTCQLWTLYSKLPSSHSSAMRSQVELRREVVRLKREMNATSSQDEFAKWAKLRRQHDKALAQYEEKSSAPLPAVLYISNSRNRFIMGVSADEA